MSVVGLTLGKAAKATARRSPAPPARRPGRRPARAAASARTRRSRRAGRRRGSGSWPSPSSRPAPCQEGGGALLGGDDARQVEDPGHLGGEVPAAGEDLVDRAVGDHAHRRRAAPPARRTPAANSTSWVATTTAGAAAGEALDQLDEVVACGRGPSRASARREPRVPAAASPSIRPARAIASASRCRSPPERSRGSASTACSSPTTPQGRQSLLARQLVADPLSDEDSRLGSGSAARCRPASRSCLGPGRPGRLPFAAACSCRRRCGPSGLPARRGRRCRSIPRRTSRGVSPGDSSTQRLRAASAGVGRVGPPLHLTCSGAGVAGWPWADCRKSTRRSEGVRPSPSSRSVDARIARASRTPTGRGSMPAREKRRAAGVVRAGSCSWDQARKSRGGPSKAMAPEVHGDDAIGGG